jgi:hypothetical protein
VFAGTLATVKADAANNKPINSQPLLHPTPHTQRLVWLQF